MLELLQRIHLRFAYREGQILAAYHLGLATEQEYQEAKERSDLAHAVVLDWQLDNLQQKE